jgi:hypothetical protein
MARFMPDLLYMTYKAVSTITFVAKAETISTANTVEASISSPAPLIRQPAFMLLAARTT